jgi:hypothetical protein
VRRSHSTHSKIPRKRAENRVKLGRIVNKSRQPFIECAKVAVPFAVRSWNLIAVALRAICASVSFGPALLSLHVGACALSVTSMKRNRSLKQPNRVIGRLGLERPR